MSLSERSISQVAEVNQTSSHYSSIANKGAKCLSNTKAYNPSKGQYTAPEVSADDALSQLRQNADGILYGFRADDRETWLKDGAKTAVKSAQAYIKKNGAGAWWDCFIALMEYQLTQNAWTEELHLAGHPDQVFTQAQVMGLAEKALGVRYMGSESKLHRWMEAFLTEHHSSRRFNPIRKKLESLSYVQEWDSIKSRNVRRRWEPTEKDVEAWDNLALRLFGTTDGMAQKKLSKWLIGTVARGLVEENGAPVQMDNVLVLYSAKQGLGKSNLCYDLGGIYADVIHSDRPAIEIQRLVNGLWIGMLDEIDGIFGKQGNSTVKSIITDRRDRVRGMRQNAAKAAARHSTFIGSTNQGQIFSDKTGSRRFWVIAIPDGHTIPRLDEWEVESIWRMAYYLYRKGYEWHMNKEDEALNEAYNRNFSTTDPIQEALEDALAFGAEPANADSWAITFTTACDLLEIKTPQRRKYAKAIKAAFEALGWEQTKKSFGGKRVTVYVKAGAETCERLTDAFKLRRAAVERVLDANLGVNVAS